MREVTVIGGGIGGLTAALALARRGARVTVLERAAEITEVGAGLQITPNGARVLHALGLAPALEAAGLRATSVEPMDGLTGRRIARFDLTELPGPPYRFLHRADLIALLARAAEAAGVAVRTGAPVSAVTPGGEIILATGERLTPELAVGADGLHSVLRPVLNGGDAPFFTGQVAWRAVIRAEAPPAARIWMFPGSHVVTYPLTKGRLNIVAVREQDDWAPEGWTNADVPEALRAAFPDACPALAHLLAQVQVTRLWGLFRHPVAQHWHGTRTALVGDAAHPTLPFLAQGANLAIEDAAVLANHVAEGDLAAGLAAYQSARRDRVRRAIRAADANAVNYHRSGLPRRLSHLALGAVSRAAPRMFLDRLDWLYGYDATRG